VNATAITSHRPDARLRWPARLASLLLSALIGVGLLVVVVGPASAEPTGGDDRVSVVTNSVTGLVIDDANMSMEAGNPIIQWPTNGGANQEWYLVKDSFGNYVLENRHSGLCLVGHTDRTVTQEPCSAPGYYASRSWELEDVGDGTYTLKSGVHCSTYLAASPSGGAGSALTLVDSGGHAVAWKIEEIIVGEPRARDSIARYAFIQSMQPLHLADVQRCKEELQRKILENLR
jgi:hypothetical protein